MSPPTGARYTAEYRPVFLKQTALKPASKAAEAGTPADERRLRLQIDFGDPRAVTAQIHLDVTGPAGGPVLSTWVCDRLCGEWESTRCNRIRGSGLSLSMYVRLSRSEFK